MPNRHTTYADLFAQPFAAYISRRSSSSSFDLSFLSEAEYESLMTWLYAAGWDLLTETRTSITVNPDANLPPRVWIPRTRPRIATDHAGQKLRHVIPRFCRHGPDCPDKETSCYYTHEDTIHCLDKVCAFDGCCASTDKRRTCIRIHPSEGQVWSPELVVQRPPATD